MTTLIGDICLTNHLVIIYYTLSLYTPGSRLGVERDEYVNHPFFKGG
jgi:hypothetical protein